MTLSTKQIYLVVENVVTISIKKNIDLNNITSQQFEEICNLATDRVIGVFKTNGFRVFPHVIAATSGLELVPLSTGGVKRTSVSSVTNFG